MYNTQNEKLKGEISKGIELLSRENIRTLGEKEKFKYLGILETDTIEQI